MLAPARDAFTGDAMLLRLATILALSLLIASLLLVVEELKQRQKDPEQSFPMYRGSDLISPTAEDIHRKTLEAAEALRGKQAESFLQHRH
jgi:hypothetical protein